MYITWHIAVYGKAPTLMLHSIPFAASGATPEKSKHFGSTLSSYTRESTSHVFFGTMQLPRQGSHLLG